MSLNNRFRSNSRPKLNSSSYLNDSDSDPQNLAQEIKLLKENFDALKTPKLYQKIVNQYKANLKNRRLADAMSNKNTSNKQDFYGSMDMLNTLRDSQKINQFKYNVSNKENDDSPFFNKEAFLDVSGSRIPVRSLADFAVQTTPKENIPLEEFAKLRTDYDHQTKIVKVMEDDLSKIRIENIKLDKALKSAQENLAVLGKNQNNTSSSFSLPSEFKANWELLAKDQIINVFSDFIDNPILVTNLIQEIIMVCYDQVKTVIKEVNCNILKILNLNEKNESDIKKHLANFYQDNHSSIFKFDESRFEKIRSLYKKLAEKIFAHEYSNELFNFPPEEDPDINEKTENNPSEEPQKFTVEIREEYQEQFEELLETDDFNKFVGSVFYLCLFMLLNDPPLRVPIENFKNRKFVYKRFKKNDYICVDGFAKENSPCLVLLPAVLRNNHPYNGVKPSVLILTEDFITPKIEKIIQECEREEQEKLAKKQEKELLQEKLEHNANHSMIDLQHNPLNITSNIVDPLSKSTNTLHHNAMTLPKGRHEQGTSTNDITIKPSNTHIEDSSIQNETIPYNPSHSQVPNSLFNRIFLTEEKENTSHTQRTPQQEPFKGKRYPLPLYDNSKNLLHSQENNHHNKIDPNSLYVKPLSMRKGTPIPLATLPYPTKDIYENSGDKYQPLNRSSFISEVRNSHPSFNIHQSGEKKPEDYSSVLNDLTTQRSQREETNPDQNSGYKGGYSESRRTTFIGASARGDSSNSRLQRYYNRETSQERDSSYHVTQLRDKIRQSILGNRREQGEVLESSFMGKLNDSGVVGKPKRNNSRENLKQTIELLKNSRGISQGQGQYDRSRARGLQDSYEKLNSSMAGKIRHQSDRLSGSFVKQIDAEDSYIDGQKSSENRQRVVENTRMTERRGTERVHYEDLKEKLRRLGMNGRSISTNRTGYGNKREEDGEIIGNNDVSFSKKGMSRVGSVNKFGQRMERMDVKETEDSLKIFRALKNIYQKNGI